MKSLIFLLLGIFSINAQKSAVEEFTTANNLFTISAYKEVAKSKTGNFLVSPFSAETVLAFAQSGAKGKSAEELRNALHLPNDQNKIESAVKTVLPKLKNNGPYTLHTANKLYVKQNFIIKDGFKDSATNVYGADIEPIDFTQNVEAATTINQWVEKHTNDKIKNLINSDDLDQYTRAVLVNALYFKGNWSNPFLLSGTRKKKFFKTPTESVEVDTLNHWEEYFNYYECPHLNAQFLELPFKGEKASLFIVLPNEKDGLEKLEKDLESVFNPQHQLSSQFLNVDLPKFKIESLIDFKQVLKNLGVEKIFNDTQADLSGIAGDKGDLYVNKVEQKSFIDVSEEGVEAAAATYVVIAVPTSARLDRPKNFEADHPFIFYIKVNNIIIFAGRVTDPSTS